MVVDLPSQSLPIPDTLLRHRSKLRFLLTLGSLPTIRMFLVTLGLTLVTPKGPRAMYLPHIIPGVRFHTIVPMVALIMVPLAVLTAAEVNALPLKKFVVLHSGMHQPR